MGRKRMQHSLKKSATSINLESWIWEAADRLDGNRSRFFRNLVIEEMKKELRSFGISSVPDEFPKEYGELYRAVVRAKRARCRGIQPGRRAAKAEFCTKETKVGSINLENWLLDLLKELEPNRSRFLSRLFINKIRDELMLAGRIKEKTAICKNHAELYIELKANMEQQSFEGRETG